jgi:hypothetical protein
MKAKERIIAKIKSIIEDIGSVNVAEYVVDGPILNSISKDHYKVIELFGGDDVTVTEYVHETEASVEDIVYEDLPSQTLKEILDILKEIKEQFYDTMDKCRDENF